jgi:pectin methylesterase-like acyl-CoA thioesterase
MVLALSVVCGSAGAAETWVPEGGNQTIQQAVNNASAYDTIIVRDGTYTENVDVSVDNLTIRSENGSEGCVVDAGGSGHGFNVTKANGSMEYTSMIQQLNPR